MTAASPLPVPDRPATAEDLGHPLEEWRPIAGFPDYSVSNEGRIRSVHVWRGRSNRLVQGWIHVSGYRYVTLVRDRKPYTRKFHKLAAEAFHGPCPEGQEVRHLDGNPLNNAVSNLRWGTKSENALDKIEHGTHPQASKTHCRNGHPYAGDNLKVVQCTDRKTGGKRTERHCRTCQAVNQRRYHARLRAARMESAA